MRIFLTVAAVVLYWMLFNYYIFALTKFGYPTAVRIYSIITPGLLLYYYIDRECGFVSHLHREFNKLCFWSVMINFMLILMVHFEIISQHASLMFWTFNGMEFVITTAILSYAKCYGFFKSE